MTGFREKVIGVAHLSFPAEKLADRIGLNQKSWETLSLTLAQAMFLKRKPLQKIWLSLTEEIKNDKAGHHETEVDSEKLLTSLAELVTGIWNLKATKPLKPENLPNLLKVPVTHQ